MYFNTVKVLKFKRMLYWITSKWYFLIPLDIVVIPILLVWVLIHSLLQGFCVAFSGLIYELYDVLTLLNIKKSLKNTKQIYEMTDNVIKKLEKEKEE